MYARSPYTPPFQANEQAQKDLIALRAAIAAAQAGLPDWAEINRLADAIEADPSHKLCALLTEAECSTVTTARAQTYHERNREVLPPS